MIVTPILRCGTKLSNYAVAHDFILTIERKCNKEKYNVEFIPSGVGLRSLKRKSLRRIITVSGIILFSSISITLHFRYGSQNFDQQSFFRVKNLTEHFMTWIFICWTEMKTHSISNANFKRWTKLACTAMPNKLNLMRPFQNNEHSVSIL